MPRDRATVAVDTAPSADATCGSASAPATAPATFWSAARRFAATPVAGAGASAAAPVANSNQMKTT